MKELIAAVRKHAEENYEKDGWDYVVECFSDEELAEDIKDCITAEEAIKAVGYWVKILDDRRQDIQATVW